MKSLIFFLLTIFLTSCNETRYKSKLVQIYRIENEKSINPINLEKLKILEFKIVGDSFRKSVLIDQFKYIVDLKKLQLKSINDQDSMMNLNIKRYKSLLTVSNSKKLDEYSRGLNKTNNDLTSLRLEKEETEREISKLNTEIKLTKNNIDSPSSKDYIFLTYLLIASNDSIQINDTLSVLINQGKNTFIKNRKITNYIGE